MRIARSLAAGLLVLALAPAVGAERPDDFAWKIPIELDARDGLQQLELDARVHQGVMRPDLADIRVFNGAGEVVPHAFLPQATEPTTAQTVALPLFPIQAERDARIDALSLKVETRADGTVVGLSTSPGRAGSESRNVGFLIDASAIDRPLAALRLAWKPPAGGTHTRVRLEESADLERWTPVVAAAALVDLEFGGHRLQRHRIEFAPRKVKYLRVAWLEGEQALDLQEATAEPAGSAAEPQRLWRAVQGQAVAGKGAQYEYDLGGIFPVDRLRFELPQANTIARVQVMVRARSADPWRPVADSVVYRLLRASAETTSPDVVLPVTRERFWLVKPDPRGGGFGAGVPVLHAGWVAQRIVFAARGEPPFQLAFGNRHAAPSAYSAAMLLPSDRDAQSSALPRARLAEQTGSAAVPAPIAERPDYRKWSLWGALLAAVALLAAMAYRLVRQLGAPGGRQESRASREAAPRERD